MKAKLITLLLSITFSICIGIAQVQNVSYYYDNGKLKETGSFKNKERDGEWLGWDEEGNKIAEVHYSNGQKDGLWIMWDSNGIKRYELYYCNGKKIGVWRMWDEKGVLISERKYLI